MSNLTTLAMAITAAAQQLRGINIDQSPLDALNAALLVWDEVETVQDAQLKPLLYGFGGQKVTSTRRQRANDSAVSLLKMINNGEIPQLSTSDKVILSRYTGTGGNLSDENGVKGSPYEYYTPKVVADAMWGLLGEYGAQGKTLDPSCGTGIFASTAPAGTLMHSVELSPISAQINSILNGSSTHRVTASPFEKVASTTADESFDIVITNVPFGSNSMRGKNKHLDKKFQNETLEEYFILRSLDKLKAGGVAMFIVPTRIVSSAHLEKFRIRCLLRADFVGGYRLPNKVFDETGADVTTDIILFRKHGHDAHQKINALYDAGSMQVLSDSRVLDQEIVAGHYFKTEGKHYVLGESQIGRGRFADVERIVNDDSVANIMKSIKRFPDSRIDYGKLETSVAPYIEYKTGDTQVMDGATFEYRNHQWHQLDVATFDDSAYATAYSMFDQDIKLADFNHYLAHLTSMGKKPEPWLLPLIAASSKASAEEFDFYLCMSAIAYILASGITHQDYASIYPKLTHAMTGYGEDVRKKLHKAKQLKAVVSRASVAFDNIPENNGLSDLWLGKGLAIQRIEIALDAKSQYENLVYSGQADEHFSVSVADISAIDATFDPLANDQYCVNSDATRVTNIRDYYSGNYADFLERIDADIAQATDVKVREKLLWQKEKAKEFVKTTDVSKFNLSLRSTNIPMQLKGQFLKEYYTTLISVVDIGDGEYGLEFDSQSFNYQSLKDGYSAAITYSGGAIAAKNLFARRICEALTNNSALSLRLASNSGINIKQHNELYLLLSSTFQELNVMFSSWIKSNKEFMTNLDYQVNAPSNKTFTPQLDSAPLRIAGFAPKLNGFKGMNSYQNEEIRRQSRRFGGICGFDVGLGKTLTALASVQSIHNIGIKKRTFFVVPNHTISKWANDIKMAYDNVDDVLVIGSNGNTSSKVSSKYYASDFNLLLSQPFRKVLMTADAFTKLPVKTISISQYLNHGEVTKMTLQISQQGREASLVNDLQKDMDKFPFFEELHVDSLVFDEAQIFKNGKSGEGKFNRIKGLSMLDEKSLATRAISASLKSWLVRKSSPQNDGVLLLTATPFTNSPVEILTMLSLAIGDSEAKQLLAGQSIKTTDDFLSTFSLIAPVKALNIAGLEVEADTFIGFSNVALLKDSIHTVANIQTARERGLSIPDQNDQTITLDLAAQDQAMLQSLKKAYLSAKKLKKKQHLTDDEERNYRYVQSLTQDNDLLMAHPFNLISRMSDVILTGADMAMTRTISFDYSSLQQKQASEAVSEFNGKRHTVKTDRRYPSLSDEYVLKVIKKKASEDLDADMQEILLHAELDEENTTITLNIDHSRGMSKFIQAAQKAGLELKPRLSAKVLAMLENFKNEMANPRHTGTAKQLIFCDSIQMHHIIKLALVCYCGVPLDKIGIINAQTLPNGNAGSPNTEHMQEIQDSFNGDSGYVVVIANQKAETGIDLQKGTQAIHHLTTRWTPDSVTQRNGRGVRQGNTIAEVRVFMYHANGTFDEYKQNMLSGKGDWIGSLMSKSAAVGGSLIVDRELTNEDYDEIIQADTPEAIAEINKRREERLTKERNDQIKGQTVLLIKMMNKSRLVAESPTILEDAAYRQVKVLDQNINSELRKMRNAKNEDQKTAIKNELSILFGYYSDFGYNAEQLLNRAINTPNYVQDTSSSVIAFNSSTVSNGIKGMHHLILGILGDQGKSSVFYQKTKMAVESAQDMAESSKAELINYEDSHIDKTDRIALASRQAVYREDLGMAFCQGDLLYDPTSPTRSYGVVMIDSGHEPEPRIIGVVIKGHTDGATSNSKVPLNMTAKNPSGKILADIMQDMVNADVSRLIKIKASGLLPVCEPSYVQCFHQVRSDIAPMVQQAFTGKMSDWLDSSTSFPTARVYMLATADSGLKKDRHLWLPSVFPDIYNAMPKMAEWINAPLLKHLTVDGDVCSVSNRHLSLFSKSLVPASEPKIIEHLIDYCEAHVVKMPMAYTDFMEFFFDRGHLAKYIVTNFMPLAKKVGADPSFDNGYGITLDQFEQMVGRALFEIFPIIKDDSMSVIAAELNKKEELKTELMQNFNVIGVDKLAKYTIKGYFGCQSKESFTSPKNFIKIYKEDIKAHCIAIQKEAKWDAVAKQWNYPTELMEWMQKQDWFDATTLVFKPATKY